MAARKKKRSDRVATDAEFRRAFKAVLREHGPAFKALADYDAGKPLAWKDEGQWAACVRGLRGVYGVGRTRRAAEADLRAAIRELDDYIEECTARMHVTFDRETDGRHIAQIKKLPGCLVYGRTRAEAEARVRKLAREIVRNDPLAELHRRRISRDTISDEELGKRLGIDPREDAKWRRRAQKEMKRRLGLRAKPATIDGYIKEWHETRTKLELHEWLGLTWEEYARFVEKPELGGILLDRIERKRRRKRTKRATKKETP